eukprot:SAG11_NODE_967_length_6356_cov_6.743008_9_plen_23_part_01
MGTGLWTGNKTIVLIHSMNCKAY